MVLRNNVHTIMPLFEEVKKLSSKILILIIQCLKYIP